MSSSEPHIVSVNVGRPRTVHSGKLEVSSAIWKFPVAGRVAVNRLNFAGDQQADLKAHGGPDKALYAYATEDLEWWAHELNTPVEVGAVGGNLDHFRNRPDRGTHRGEVERRDCGSGGGATSHSLLQAGHPF